MKLISTFTVIYCPVDGCDSEKPFKESSELLKHLTTEHEIKIHEPAAVEPFLDQYLERYKGTLREGTFLGSEDEEDFKFRQTLHLKMLNGLLETQQMERNTIYKASRMCLFCSSLCENLPELFNHMFQEHHFNIGLLDNLIFVDVFLSDLEEKTKLRKQCIFCNEVFRNGTCLRKHLKSKNHFKINGKDERWDRFYLVNYVNLVKSKLGEDKDEFVDQEEGVDEWDDLTDEIDLKTQCLFCDGILMDPESCFNHMIQSHGFSIKTIQKKHGLSFYDTMKLLNYLRHCQQHEIDPFENDGSIGGSFEKNEIPDMKLWNRPEFYFPVYEEDPLLTAIEDSDEEYRQENELVEEFNNKM